MAQTKLWTLKGDGRTLGPTDSVAPDERLSWGRTVGIGTQHVVAMFGATFLVPILTGFPPTTTIFFSGLGTLIFILLTMGRGQRLGLPSYMGSSFAFISPIVAAKTQGGMSAALCGIVAVGVVFFLIGFIVDRFGSHWINVVMPAAVTGTIVALIGLNLAPVAVKNFQEQPVTALITMSAIILFSVGLPGFLGRISILLGVVLGYFVAWPQGQLDLKKNWDAAPWVGLPEFTTPTWSLTAIGLVLPVVVVLIAENTGHIKALGSMTGKDLDPSLGRAFMGGGAATVVAGMGGGSGCTTYSENIGVMAATRVYSTAAYVVAGITGIVLSMIPKFGAVIVSIPIGVLGGATIVLYGLIAILGGRIWVENKVDFTNGVNLFPAAIGLIIGAADMTWNFGSLSFNGIALGTAASILAYHVMNYLAKVGPGHGELYIPPPPKPVTSTETSTGTSTVTSTDAPTLANERS